MDDQHDDDKRIQDILCIGDGVHTELSVPFDEGHHQGTNILLDTERFPDADKGGIASKTRHQQITNSRLDFWEEGQVGFEKASGGGTGNLSEDMDRIPCFGKNAEEDALAKTSKCGVKCKEKVLLGKMPRHEK